MSTDQLITLTIMMSGLIVIALVLLRYRDRLQHHFKTGPITLISTSYLSGHAQVHLISIGAHYYLCGSGREGVQCITEVPRPPEVI